MAEGARGRELGRLAWWGWLTCGDSALALRLREQAATFPPWLDGRAWLFAGLLPGLLAGWLASRGLWPLRDGPAWQQHVLALVTTLFVCAGLAARDPQREGPDDFARRLAAVLLHTPYLALAAASLIAFSDWASAGLGLPLRLDLGGVTPGMGLILLDLAVLLFIAVTFTTPRAFGAADAPAGAPGGAASFGLRLAAILLYGLVLATEELRFLEAQGFSLLSLRSLLAIYPIEAGVREGALLAFALLLTMRWQERLALGAVEAILGREPARARRWPALLKPLPFSLERVLLASPRAENWRLAADYARAQRYSARELTRVGAEGDDRKAGARPALLALTLLWQGDVSGDAAADVRRRLFERLRHSATTLTPAVWHWLSGLLRDDRRLPWLLFVLLERRALRVTVGPGWQILRQVRWTQSLDLAAADERLELLWLAFDLLAELNQPRALQQALRDLDDWREGSPEAAAALPSSAWLARLLPLIEALPATTDATDATALGLRLAAARAARGDAAALAEWYQGTKEFEALPAGRQRDLLSPFGYRELWRLVLARHPDPEEEARQEERYLTARQRRTGRADDD